MYGLPSSVRIYLSTELTDMRKGHDGLAALVRKLNHDVFSGHLYVFLSRRCDRVKILSWDRGGFVLWYKRLEKGRFRLPKLSAEQRSVSLDSGQLSMLLEGIDYSRITRPKRWEPPNCSTEGSTFTSDHDLQ
jgi:transposase